MYEDLMMFAVVSIISFILGIVATIYTIIRLYIVLNKRGLENTWNLGASYGDTDTFPDIKKEFEEYYNHLKKNS